MHDDVQIIILAAGKGTRMASEKPKVLHEVGGVALIDRVISAAREVGTPVLIVGAEKEMVTEHVSDEVCVEQIEQLGTGHAVLCAEHACGKGSGTIMVLPGDHPFITKDVLVDLYTEHQNSGAKVTMVTAVMPNTEGIYEQFFNFGRVVRGEDGSVERIVEMKDATDEEKEIREVNISYYCFESDWLWSNVCNIQNNNKAGEYYLTDLVGMAKEQGERVHAYILKDPRNGLGINTPEQLQAAEKISEEL